ncbi:MAG: hypothetical protein BWY74_04062 [Firmicutes bacterium ADurb.Bin419]|mgnify:CR=1 FL=1|nr:MAG: hypothetical protein BWY74_04062 [Firmicutes bacterium ADurb.Bin419]HMT02718.1 hypothetical protein [Burkholderiales bacterium]
MQKTSTQFKKGERNTGRQKGTKNKNTLVIETFAKTIVEGGMDKFQNELNSLTGKPYIEAYMTLFEYVKPKLARTEHTGKDGGDINISATDKIVEGMTVEQLFEYRAKFLNK